MGTTQARRWSRTEYERMIETGFFSPDERLELIGGEILEVTPQSSRHAAAVTLVQKLLMQVYQEGYVVRTRLPLALDLMSEPEPDFAVVEGSPRQYSDGHPTTAVLVIEVAGTTLHFDRGSKAGLYAMVAIPSYWILNIEEGCLEVYSAPCANPTSRFNHDYAKRLVLRPDDRIPWPGVPGIPAIVKDMLPWIPPADTIQPQRG